MRDRGVRGVPSVDEPSPRSTGHRAAVQRAAQNAIFAICTVLLCDQISPTRPNLAVGAVSEGSRVQRLLQKCDQISRFSSYSGSVTKSRRGRGERGFSGYSRSVAVSEAFNFQIRCVQIA